MGIGDRFRAAFHQLQDTQWVEPAQLPIRLSQACAAVLPVTGAGLSLFSAPTMRIPVGASDATATTAERAQFTVAQGPCFHAHDTGHRIVATEDVIARQWPLFYDLIVQTPVRGILATPLRDELFGVGVLDLYFDQSDGVTAINVNEVDEIAGIITSALVREEMFPNLRNGPIWNGPLWLNNPTVTSRAYVMMAMGMLSVSSGLTLDDSLAALRGHAYAAGRTVDAIASDVVNRVLPTAILADN